MRFKKLFVVTGLILFSGFAQAKQFEYKNVEYTIQAEFMTKAKELGEQGWELASCITSDATNYSAFSPGAGSISGLKFARTSYCIFKREI